MEPERFYRPSESYKKIRGQIDYDLHLTPYWSMSSKLGLPLEKLKSKFSRNAFVFFSHRLHSYVIAYNDKLPITEILYHVLHEIGHIYYGHISPDNDIAVPLAKQETVASYFATFIFSKIGGMKMQTLTGNEHFTYDGMPIGILLNDFWAWNSSDLLNNTLRGALAEFIVASSIGLDTNECREDWTAFDLQTKSGRKIEVKCSSYLQSWNAERLSKIQFSIRSAYAWDAESNYSEESKRWSDLYVFCLYASKKRDGSPLQLESWEFYVLPTYVLNEKCNNQKSINLNSLLKLNPTKTTYENLNEVIENLQIIYDPCEYS